MSLIVRNRRGIWTPVSDLNGPTAGEGRHTPLHDDERGIAFEVDKMVDYVREFQNDQVVVRTSRKLVELCSAKDKVCEMRVLFEWTKNHFRYVNDPINEETIQTPVSNLRELQTPPTLLRELLGEDLIRRIFGFQVLDSLREGRVRGKHRFVCRACFGPDGVRHSRTSGDCIPYSQKIIVRDRSDFRYKVVPIGDLEKSWKYYHVVSYNESDRKLEFKPIRRFVDKGRLPVFRVKLSNGTEFRCTENHELYVFEKRLQTGGWSLELMTLKDLMELRKSKKEHHRLAIPVAKGIPEAGLKSRWVPEVSDEQLWIEGLYVAEGWSERMGSRVGRGVKSGPLHVSKRSKIGMNNPVVIAELEEKLGVIGQTYGRHVRPDGLITVRMNGSEFTRRLGSEFGLNSFSKRFPDWYTSLSRRQLEVLLSAYTLGDGYVPKTGNWSRSVNLIHNTASEALARQLAFMHLVVGRPIAFYRQLAWKSKPAMYRLYEYKSYAEEKAPDLTSARIVSIEKDESERCCDIEVSDNHNFLLDGGVLVHNCDEGALFLATLLASIGIEPRFRFGGQRKGSDCDFYHVWVVGKDQNGEWIDMDVTEVDSTLGWIHPSFTCTGIRRIFE